MFPDGGTAGSGEDGGVTTGQPYAGQLSSGRWRFDPAANPAATMLCLWWLPFAAISAYWAGGGTWLVDTAVEEYGQQLAVERPLWIVVLLSATVVVKLGFVAFGYLLVAPVGRSIPRWLYILCGCAVGGGSALYGLAQTVFAIPYLLDGTLSERGWWRLLLWMPQFWVGGVLMLVATIVFQRSLASRGASVGAVGAGGVG